MRFSTFHFLQAALVSAALIIPAAIVAQEHPPYHDAAHNDDHQWNSHEDKAYRIWVKQNHRKYSDFAKLKAEDQQSYWAWRHEHTDVQLKINIP